MYYYEREERVGRNHGFPLAFPTPLLVHSLSHIIHTLPRNTPLIEYKYPNSWIHYSPIGKVQHFNFTTFL